MSNEYKVTYMGKEFCGDSMEEVLLKCQEFEATRIKKLIYLFRSAGGTYCYNGDHDGIEIRFDKRPELDAVEELTANGWRWHRAKRCWYAKRTAQNVRLAVELCGGGNDSPEQERQKLLLSVREAMNFGFSWRREYESYTSDQLRTLLEEDERKKLCTNLPSDYFRYHNISFSYDSDIELLRSLKKPGEAFESQCRRVERSIEEAAERLFESAYWYQVGLYEQEESKRNFAEHESSLGLKESSFWETFKTYGENLQPIDVARRMGFTYSYSESLSGRNPKCERLAMEYVKKMKGPDYDYSMKEEDFTKVLAVLYYKDDVDWKHICRKYCLGNSRYPNLSFGTRINNQTGDVFKDYFSPRYELEKRGKFKLETPYSGSDEIPF